MKSKRSTRVLTLGVAVFLAGTALTFIGLRSGDAKAKPAAQAPVKAAAAPVTGVKASAGAAAAPNPLAVVPDGMEAVAVQLPYVPGVAGYVQPGALVNVYATIKNQQPNTRAKQPLAKLVLSNVRVVDVKSPAPGTEGNATFLLALTPKDAEQVIFLARYESLWFTLVKTNAKPAQTSGRSYQNVL
jgi:Flp pilus assembly protein CpaB